VFFDVGNLGLFGGTQAQNSFNNYTTGTVPVKPGRMKSKILYLFNVYAFIVQFSKSQLHLQVRCFLLNQPPNTQTDGRTDRQKTIYLNN